MSKAVLVIDMPKRCKDCFRYRADAWFGGSCTQAKEENGWNKKIDADEEYNVQNWCPLRPYQEAIPVWYIIRWYEKRYKLGSTVADDWERGLLKEKIAEMYDDFKNEKYLDNKESVRYAQMVKEVIELYNNWETENEKRIMSDM